VPGRFYYNLAYVFYGLSLAVLLYAIVTGVVSKGASRWISIAGIRLQPSEFAKIGLLFALARYLSKRNILLGDIRSLIVPGLLILVPFLLVLKQPDLGTAMVFCAMSLPIFYWAGMNFIEIFFLTSPVLSIFFSAIPLILSFHSTQSYGIGSAIPWGIFFITLCVVLYITRIPRFMVIVIVVLSIVAATFTTVLWSSFLKDYQKARIISFINPQVDAFGSGYQVIQSKVAVGSGYIFGKGYLQGSQSRLSYLPEQHTDFIFSVLGEQFGLVGCFFILLLFLFVSIRGIVATQVVRNRFTNLVIVGSVSIIAFHVFINIAMAIGMMPVTGVPLPFLSYGGSFAITIAILIGLILNAKVSSQNF
jgi:rod shape determining protein RodA